MGNLGNLYLVYRVPWRHIDVPTYLYLTYRIICIKQPDRIQAYGCARISKFVSNVVYVSCVYSLCVYTPFCIACMLKDIEGLLTPLDKPYLVRPVVPRGTLFTYSQDASYLTWTCQINLYNNYERSGSLRPPDKIDARLEKNK